MLNKFLKVDIPEQGRKKKLEKEQEKGGLDLKLEEIVKYMPNLLNFDNKRAYFIKELRKRNVAGGERDKRMEIDRKRIFMDTFN
jgi:hypothetical protein